MAIVNAGPDAPDLRIVRERRRRSQPGSATRQLLPREGPMTASGVAAAVTVLVV